MDNDSILIIVSRIEKLWRQANNAGATPAEREAFEAKALSLMEQHRITEAMLDIEGVDVLDDFEYGMVEGRYTKVITNDIIHHVAAAYDCRVWWNNRGRGRRRVWIFGFKRDAERVIAMSRMLVTQGFAEAAKEKGYNAGDTYSLRHSFLQGFGYSVGMRLREAAVLANKAVTDSHGEAATKGAALVLVNRREQVHAEYKARHSGLRHDSATRTGHRGAWYRGLEAGNTARLSNQGQVATRKALSA